MSHYSSHYSTKDYPAPWEIGEAAHLRMQERMHAHKLKIRIGVLSVLILILFGQIYGVWNQLSGWSGAIGATTPTVVDQPPAVPADSQSIPAAPTQTPPATATAPVQSNGHSHFAVDQKPPAWQVLNDDEFRKALSEANGPAKDTHDADQAAVPKN